MGLQVFPIISGAPLPAGDPAELGGKAWGLARMAGAGLPVPPAFVLPTQWCRAWRAGRVDEAEIAAALAGGIARLEAASGLGFGDPRRPLLVSVRSGAARSMPGMMETLLDVGLSLPCVAGLLRRTGNPRLAWDCRRRLIEGFATVVRGLPADPFEAILAEAIAAAEAENERDLDHAALRAVAQAMEARLAEAAAPLPADPARQLCEAAMAVLRSWDSPKAASYRRLHGLDDDAGTALTVQAMVFGNAGGASGSGVGFTRDPASGERGLYVDFVFNGQGEDVVAGRRRTDAGARLRRVLPALHTRLEQVGATLEGLFGDAQDFEFTLQSGTLWLLQARAAKRTPWAALRIAVDLVAEGLLTPAAGRHLLEGVDLAAAVRTRFADPGPVIARAQIAGLGVASGRIALDTEAAARLSASAPVILVRAETATEDIEGMARAAGILTATGSRTSHAAVVARQLGRVCLVGCEALTIDLAARSCTLGGRVFAEGDFIALDGNEGTIHDGAPAILTERPEAELAVIASWPG